ncbi:MAG: hypothetical protein KF797_11215 [Flavobacteriales bacterium]|nr:hypothetical protein [Flavobacteriales bacterium]
MRTTITTLIITAPFALMAQTTYYVEVGGSTLGPALPYYSPNVLNILVGDTVTWQNASGTHNVNASTFFFPANPEGFVNGDPSSDNWTFSHVFTIPGVYNYMCMTEGHSATQTGRVLVTDGTSVPEAAAEAPIALSPTSATDHLFVEVGSRSIDHFEVMGLDGRLMATHAANTGRMMRIPVAALPQGNYLLRIVETSGRATTLRFSRN